MANAPSGTHLQHICTLLDAAALADATDGQLLARFVAQGDERAFAALLQRHGPMVLAVARRLLRQPQDAEDVFQATFLLLARQAGSIRQRDAVASWLHGVACRLALKVRREWARRQTHERRAAARQPVTAAPAAAWQELQELLDGTLQGLPEKYRAVLVLCCLEDRSLEEAARRLGCPVGTVGSRLARGRELLRRRLSRRGLVLSAEALATALAAGASSAAVPAALATATVNAGLQLAAGQALAGVVPAPVAALVQSGVQSLALTRLLPVLTLLLTVGLLAAGTGAWMQPRGVNPPPVPMPPEVPANEPLPGDHRPKPAVQVVPLPKGAVARLGDVRFVFPPRGVPGGSWSCAPSVALSADGRGFAYAGDKDIFIRDGDTAELLRQFPAPGNLNPRALVWSHDDRLLASFNKDGTFIVCNAVTGEPTWRGPRTCGGICVTAQRFIAKDQFLAVVGAPVRPEQSHGEFAIGYPGAFEPWTVELWDVHKGELARTWNTRSEDAKADLQALGDGCGFCYVALSPSGERMAWLASLPPGTREGNSAVFLYETRSGRRLQTITDLPRSYRVDLPDEGETLVVHPIRPASVDRKTIGQSAVVHIADGKVRFRCDHRFLPPVYAWDGWGLTGRVLPERSSVRIRDALLTFDGYGMVRWDWKTGRKLDEYDLFFNRSYTGVTTSADRTRVAAFEGNRLRIGDGPLAPWQKDPQPGYAPSLRFLPDGRLHGVAPAERSTHGSLVQVWDPSAQRLLESYRVHPSPVDVEFHYGQDISARLLTYLDVNNNLVVHDLAANQRLGQMPAQNGRLVPSPDGRRLLHFHARRSTPDTYQVEVRWFDARTIQELGRYEYAVPRAAAEDPVHWFAHDGSVFGHRTADLGMALVDCATKKTLVRVGPIPAKGSAFSRYASAGFDRLILGKGPTHDQHHQEHAVWDRRGNLLRQFAVHWKTRVMPETHLSQDGRVLATYTWHQYDPDFQKDVILYETATGRYRGRFVLSQDPVLAVTSLDFSPDGKRLATSSADAVILLWDLARPLSGKDALPPPRDAREAERLWELLGHAEPTESDRALWALVAAPEQALRLLTDRLQPVARRQQPAAILAHVRELRALEVLERIGSAAARKRVEAVAAGAEGAVPTCEAQLILARWHETTGLAR